VPVARLVRTVEQIIARIAGAQHGIVTWAEMLAADISENEIRHRVDIGLLVRVHRGVYSVGHPPLTWQARYVAAVKACGEGALLCGRAAAYLLGIFKSPIPPPPEVATRTEKRIRGVATPRLKLVDRDITEVKGIPCTTPARTIVDLAPKMDDDPFARVCHEAGVLHRTTPRQVKAAMERKARRCPGAARIRRVMQGEVKVSLSVYEKGFLDALSAAGLPLPDQVNKRVGGKRVDCRWSKYGVTVELLSYRFHNSKYSWDQDHERKRQARARGDKWRSFTYDDVFKDQTYMLAELRELLR
jgi:predicted transcriptional regulator of viral defense system